VTWNPVVRLVGSGLGHIEIVGSCLQALKAEKRQDGVWYYLLHYQVSFVPAIWHDLAEVPILDMQIMQQKAKTVPDGAPCSPLRQGWNKKWDEWVEAPGLVKYDAKLVRSEDDKKGEGEGGPHKKRRTDGRGGGGAGSDAVAPVAEASDKQNPAA